MGKHVARSHRLKRNALNVDLNAFTIISDSSEELGYGFINHG